MIRYIPHDEIDFEKWDNCIDNAINGIFYAWSWYLNMCTDSWDALVEDDYLAVMPLPLRRKYGITYVYQPFFIQQLGIFSTYSLSEDVANRFLQAIPKSIRYAAFNMNTYNRLPGGHNAINGRGITHELDLIAPYEQIRYAYSTNLKRNIKKAEKTGVYVTSHARPDDIITAFRQNSSRYRVHYKEEDYRVLKHIIYSGMHKGLVNIKAAYGNTNNFCGGIIFYKSHKKAVWLFSGATPEARQNGAMSLLADLFIRENAGSEMVLDFEGSKNPNLARFYRAFGSEECVFLQIRINNMPFLFKGLTNSIMNLKASWKNRT